MKGVNQSFFHQQSGLVETPPAVARAARRRESEAASSRSSVIEARKSIHLADVSEFEVIPDLTNFRPVTLTVSSFFKQVTVTVSFINFLKTFSFFVLWMSGQILSEVVKGAGI